MITLALETSVQPGSIALLSDAVTVYESEFPGDQRTTQSFALQIQLALTQSGLTPKDVSLFAVTRGPGSFTGLRIGVTAAKTFAYAVNCQVLGVDTLDVIAEQATEQAVGDLEVIMDAQRGQLFVARFRVAQGVATRLTPTEIVDLNQWLADRSHHVTVTGPALRLCGEKLESTSVALDSSRWTPTAASLGCVARNRFLSGERQAFWELTPTYYRKSAAEEKWEQRKR